MKDEGPVVMATAFPSSFRLHPSSLLFEQLFPLRVDGPPLWFVRADVGVRAEEVALRLREVEGQIGRPVGVEVADRGRHAGDG